jgi:hypothetical protein
MSVVVTLTATNFSELERVRDHLVESTPDLIFQGLPEQEKHGFTKRFVWRLYGSIEMRIPPA